jgi:light-regulated signal transduction histidine kinase (bacteriophytochrome)
VNAEAKSGVASVEASAAAARVNESLAEFAFGASHDLKEPLRTITTYAQLLERKCADQLTEEASKYVAEIVGAAGRMRAVIEDLVAYSQAQSLDIPMQPAPLDDVVSLALIDLKTLIRERRAAVTHGPLPMVLGDVVQLTRVFQNLIANSIKYAKEGEPPKIHISAFDRGSEWIIQVTDNGIGFDPKYSERIFQPFKRLHDEQVPGTGLGLAITRKLVERHGGRIWANSEPGKGTTFSLALQAA